VTIAAELLSRLSAAAPPDARVLHAVETLTAARGELPVRALAARVGLSERQLERVFDERVGYGPKTFGRILRMNRAVESIARTAVGRGRMGSWASFAREWGYADQAHLIREFRALTGVTPCAYASTVSEIDNSGAPPVATVVP
jgi:AraC-like DNA-binding protein